MRKLFFMFVMFVSFVANSFAQDIKFNGSLDSTFQIVIDDKAHTEVGFEEFANFRLNTNIADVGTFYAAFNAIYGAGTLKNTAIEIERLYFRLSSDYTDLDTGLQRIAFGYSSVFSPSDFLNPKNPLQPYARPKGVLGINLSAYPLDMLDIKVFGLMPGEGAVSTLRLGSGTASSTTGLGRTTDGYRFGTSADSHFDNLSLQGLYVYEIEKAKPGIHRFGASLKADIEVGFVAEGLYKYDARNSSGIDGLSASAGFDYSIGFETSSLYLLTEYLYSGKQSNTSFDIVVNPLGYTARHNLYALLQYNFDSFTNISLAFLTGIDISTYTPIVTFQSELFQGFSLSLAAQVPIIDDRANMLFMSNIKYRF
jgi:hypothetical protein